MNINKPLEILELETKLSTELFLTNFKNEAFIKINKSYHLDAENNVIALNLRYSKIIDLKYLEKFESLISLHLGDNDLKDISALSNLKNLKYLNLEGNKISDISSLRSLNQLQKLIIENNLLSNILPLKNLTELNHLNISKNNISNISTVKNLKKLKSLQANSNSIKNISHIGSLKDLERIYFSNNQITDISPLKRLFNLQEFSLTNNYIFDLSPIYYLLIRTDFTRTHNFYENPLIYPPTEIYLKGDAEIIIWFREIIKNVNRKINECIKKNSKSLKLSNLGITDLRLIPKIFDCTHIETLILSNEWAEYKNFLWSKVSINQSPVRNNLYEIPRSIIKLKNLKNLIIGGDWANESNIPSWRIKNINIINSLSQLETLNVSNNQITSIDNLANLMHLSNFHFNNNQLYSVFNLGKYQTLKSVNASNNNLKSLFFLKNLRSLEMLDLHSNNLSNIDELEDIIKNLKKLVINNNPIVEKNNWKLYKYDNHLETVLNYFSKKLVRGSKEYRLPIKVLMLGNHASGKSTLLDYLISSKKPRHIIPNKNSTHIVRIEQFRNSKKNILPEIIFFDFGGQDYYHGIYKAFLTNDAINILLWTVNHDCNQIRIDNNGLFTRDFTKEYWLAQLKYYYTKRHDFEKLDSEDSKNDVVLIAQTHGDENDRISFTEDSSGLNIVNQFYIALDQKANNEKELFKLNLDHFEASLKYEIQEKKKQDRFKVSQPLWYLNFLKYIFSIEDANSISLVDLRNHYKRPIKKHEKKEDLDRFFVDDLDQLHRQGLILFYKNFEKLNNVAWLNPAQLTKHIHNDILNKKSLSEKFGDVDETTFLSLVSDTKIIELLQQQKVIFFDKEKKRYIIPSFLRLANDQKNRNDYDIMTFGFDEPNFVLKFKKFIPFGIVNQMICHFGNNPNSKFFWRDQLIFTLKSNIQILLRLDFDNLEIFIYINSKNLKQIELENVENYIFNCFLAIYHDTPLLEFESYEQDRKNNRKGIVREDVISVNFYDSINKLPDDLYISVDNKWFIKGSSLVSLSDEVKITAFAIREVVKEKKKSRVLSSEISKDVPIYEFQSFTGKKLIKLKKIFISYSKSDLKLIHEFQDHLSSLKRAGIISSWYCTELIAGGDWDKEISKHFDEADIICFMVSPNFMRTEYIYKYELQKAIERKKNDDSFIIIPIILDFCSWNNSKSNLGMYTALPYTAKPICDFDNRNMAWYIVIECIKFLMNNFLQPKDDDWFTKQALPTDVKKIYERIVNGLVDKNTTK